MLKSLYTAFFLIFLINIAASDNLDSLKDLIKKSDDHGRLIKTIRMKVSINKNYPDEPPIISKYSLIYRKKDNHWKGEFKRNFNRKDENTGKWIIKENKGIHEQIEETNLIFNVGSNCGVIEKKLYEGFGGIVLHGLSGINHWSYNLDIFSRIKEGRYNIKSIGSIKHRENEAYEVILEGKGERLRWVFVPGWQYSVAVQEAELTDPEDPTIHKTDVEMKKDPSTGIWFPYNVNIELKSKGSIQRTETIEYRNVVLNKPVDDDEISFKIPIDARLTHDIEKETYALKEPATLENILSGKVKSIQKMATSEWEKTATVNRWKQFLKMSMAFRIFIILCITIALYFILNMVRKKILDKKSTS